LTGILAGAPAIKLERAFITNELYPQIVAQRDLGWRWAHHWAADGCLANGRNPMHATW